MATTKGKGGVLTVGGEIVGELKSMEVTETSNEVDTSTMGTDWTGVDSTQTSWKATGAMFWDPLDAGQGELVVGTKVAVIFYPAGNTTGLVEETGTALVTSIGRQQAHDNIIEASIELTGDGALVKDVVA